MSSSNYLLQDYQFSLMLLEQQNRDRLLTASGGSNDGFPSDGDTPKVTEASPDAEHVSRMALARKEHGNLLKMSEQQDEKVMLERLREQDTAVEVPSVAEAFTPSRDAERTSLELSTNAALQDPVVLLAQDKKRRLLGNRQEDDVGCATQEAHRASGAPEFSHDDERKLDDLSLEGHQMQPMSIELQSEDRARSEGQCWESTTLFAPNSEVIEDFPKCYDPFLDVPAADADVFDNFNINGFPNSSEHRYDPTVECGHTFDPFEGLDLDPSQPEQPECKHPRSLNERVTDWIHHSATTRNFIDSPLYSLSATILAMKDEEQAYMSLNAEIVRSREERQLDYLFPPPLSSCVTVPDVDTAPLLPDQMDRFHAEYSLLTECLRGLEEQSKREKRAKKTKKCKKAAKKPKKLTADAAAATDAFVFPYPNTPPSCNFYTYPITPPTLDSNFITAPKPNTKPTTNPPPTLLPAPSPIPTNDRTDATAIALCEKGNAELLVPHRVARHGRTTRFAKIVFKALLVLALAYAVFVLVRVGWGVGAGILG